MIKSRMRFIDRRINPPRIHGAVSADPSKPSRPRLKFGMEAIGHVVRIRETGVELNIEGAPGFLPVNRTCPTVAGRCTTFLKLNDALSVRIVRRGGGKDGAVIVALDGLSLCKHKRGEHVGLVITRRHRHEGS